MLSSPDLLRLARLYAIAEAVAVSTVGKRGCGNHKVFRRLIKGQGIAPQTSAQLEGFFRDQWPQNAPWPEDIPHATTRQILTRSADTARAT